MKIDLSGPDITQAEIDAVVQVLRTPTLSLGPKLGEFETLFADVIGRRYGVAVNSGTSALHLCLLALGIGPGDEVVTTPFSFIATTNCVLMAGAHPVLADIDPVTYNLDAGRAAATITERTKALLPVEVFGNPAGIDALYDLARQRALLCLEDSCEGLGSVVNGRKVGTLGDMSTFAFYPNKQITTGEGGIILTDHEPWAALCCSLRNQGRDAGGGWLAHARLGYNYRLSDIQCALGIAQLRRLEELKAKRRRVFEMYRARLSGEQRLVIPQDPPGCQVNWFVYVVRLRDEFTPTQRDRLLERLRQAGIGCSNYFSPIHLQPFIQERLGYQKGDFPVTERIAERTLALPFCNNLTEEQVDTVCRALQKSLDTL
ncbi:MAG: DegT/DnrJ/EryC1/StrS family aminotransferase [Sedimentisphaerales bacterium]|nr:DegT/DnrJ/EryC1/StrS family aminotransferase [Sedimentisphaerales bacterium]